MEMDGPMRPPRQSAFFLFRVIILATMLAACGGGDDDTADESAIASPTSQASLADASPTVTEPAESGQTAGGSPTVASTATARATAEATETETEEPEADASPTARPRGIAPIRPIATQPSAPAPDPTEEPSDGGQASDGDLTIVQQGFSQVDDYDEVAWGFVVENADDENAAVDTSYLVEIYDADDVLLESDESYIDYVMPGARQGVGGSIFIPEDSQAERMEVSIVAGTAEPPPLNPQFSLGPISYFGESLFPVATTALTVSTEFPLEDIEVIAIGYDEAGEIIGGGYSFVSFIIPGQPLGVEISLSSAEPPATVEIFPTVTNSTVFAAESAAADTTGAQPLAMVQQGWGESDTYPGEVGWGFVITNPNDGLAAETTRFQATAYATDGTVLATSNSYLSLVLPGETLGAGGSLYLPDEAQAPIDRVDIQILARAFITTDLTPGFLSVREIAYVDDEFSPKATGIVSNVLGTDLEQVEVYAVAYNEAGEIIGGGWSYVELVPAGSQNANGQAAAEVALATAGDPARVEMYATITNPSALE